MRQPRSRLDHLRHRRRRRTVVTWLALAGAVVATAATDQLLHGGTKSRGNVPQTAPAISLAGRRTARRRLVWLAEHVTGALRGPLHGAAAVALDGRRMMLIGGLTAADLSTDDILIAGEHGGHRIGGLPIAVHDTAAVRLGRLVYVFGGGTDAGTQRDDIVRISANGRSTVIGHLPNPSSDQSAAALDGIAYVVGGFTGTAWLDTIVAWRPGAPARIVARLPFPVRYAAVASARGRLLIAGGSLETGDASRAVFEFTPGNSKIRRIGSLPSATTHAAAATLNDIVYVIGGRGANRGSVTSRVIGIDPRTDRIRAAGRLVTARSDLIAAGLGAGNAILLAGGQSRSGSEAGVSELRPETIPSARHARSPSAISASVSAYAHDAANMLHGAARSARSLVYVPDSRSARVDVIDPRSYHVVERFPVQQLPQHIVPSYDLKTLYVTNDIGNSLTTIDPRTGKPGRTIPVADPYNMYFTPGGDYAIVVAERLRRLDFRDAKTFALHHSLAMPCVGVDHLDFSLDGSYLVASCEFSGQLVKVDVRHERVVGVLDLPDGTRGEPQDVRISPDGSVFYVADLTAAGVWQIDGRRLRTLGFVQTGAGAHGLYPSRDGSRLYVSNRTAGTVSVIRFATGKVVATWAIPGGSPDMGGVSADGRTLWLSGRYSKEVYAISTQTGRLRARIHVGDGPHGLCVWPQPGRYSLGHTGNMR